MKRPDPHSDHALERQLEGGRVIQPVPDVVRARSLSRARATMAAIAAVPHEPVPTLRRLGLIVALAASVALAVGATAVAAVLLGRASSPRELAPPELPHLDRPAHITAREVVPSLPTVFPPSTLLTNKPQHARRPATARESYAAELQLLQRVQVAYADREFGDALALVSEHGRRFPSGRLAEEREVLRVRALSGAGRTEEASRAEAAFAALFPRSILLPRSSGEPR
jgi:hypothetical protein